MMIEGKIMGSDQASISANVAFGELLDISCLMMLKKDTGHIFNRFSFIYSFLLNAVSSLPLIYESWIAFLEATFLI